MFNSFSIIVSKIFHNLRFKLSGNYKSKILSFNPIDSQLAKGVVYIIQKQTYKKWLYLTCPCGCKDTIMLSLSKNRRPCWDFHINKNKTITINPSINRLEGCYSHFWLKNGKIEWCEDSGKKKNTIERKENEYQLF